MGLFACNHGGVVENTALSSFWLTYRPQKGVPSASGYQCDPDIRRSHGQFERNVWDGKREVMNRIQVELDGNVYWVDQNTVIEADPGRMICHAWKVHPIREVVNFSKLDQLDRKTKSKRSESHGTDIETGD